MHTPQSTSVDHAPAIYAGRAWSVVVAGMSINLCLGILYAWSVWKSKLVATPTVEAGTPMTGLDAGWHVLTDTQATVAYTLCGLVFALFMIPGGKVQDRFGPRIGATAAGLFLGAGCLLAGWMKSYLGLMLGFGLLGGIGMGLGYAAATPAAVKWFEPHRRGLIVGLVVGGFGGAAIYISPLANFLIAGYGISGSLVALGLLFATVIVVAAQFLKWPPVGYQPPAPTGDAAQSRTLAPTLSRRDWRAGEMLKTWQFYVLVLLFFGSAQSGLLVIVNATPLMLKASKHIDFFLDRAWILASFLGLVNAAGRICTGLYSDRIGRRNAYLVNGAISAVCLLLTPLILESQNVWLLFLATGIATWQYGGGLSLLPAMTADFFGAKNLGFNYGLVFIGWGLAFLVPLAAGRMKDIGIHPDNAFYLSCGLLVAALVCSRFVRKPVAADEAAVVPTS